MWLVYSLSGSTALTGVAGFLARAPGALGFLFGPPVDRAPLGRLLVGSELLQGALVLVVPVTAVFDALTVPVVLAVVIGSVSAVVLCFGLAFVPVGSYTVLVMASLQSGVPQETVGRVSATATSVISTVAPLGILIGGFLGDAVGSDLVVVGSAVGFALIAGYWFLVPTLRRFSAIDALEPNAFVA
jgi:hypothetical protein